MTQVLINGVQLKRLRSNVDWRGFLMEIMRPDWETFQKFGQAYVTSAYSGVVKGWHYHKKQRDNFVCVRGMMVMLYNGCEDSSTKGVSPFILIPSFLPSSSIHP
jgi:dTDP-4-dehydrorhamnose 3,5-epimerase